MCKAAMPSEDSQLILEFRQPLVSMKNLDLLMSVPRAFITGLSLLWEMGLYVEGCIVGLCQMLATTLPTSCDNHKGLQTLRNIPWGWG